VSYHGPLSWLITLSLRRIAYFSKSICC